MNWNWIILKHSVQCLLWNHTAAGWWPFVTLGSVLSNCVKADNVMQTLSSLYRSLSIFGCHDSALLFALQGVGSFNEPLNMTVLRWLLWNRSSSGLNCHVISETVKLRAVFDQWLKEEDINTSGDLPYFLILSNQNQLWIIICALKAEYFLFPILYIFRLVVMGHLQLKIFQLIFCLLQYK